MNKIEALIEHYCPEGVQIKTIGDLGELVRGNGLQKKDFTETGIGCIHYGQIYTFYGVFAYSTKSFVSHELAKSLKKVRHGDLIIASTSENVEDVCKTVAWLGGSEIVTGGHATILRHQQNPKYLAYLTQTEMFFEQKKQYAKGTKVIDVSAKDLAKIKVPIPPLPVQEEIVNILDKFTALEAELEAELEARKTQYEYYRNQLLSFDGKEVEWKTLGELGKFTRGRRFVKNDIISEGVPCIHYGEMYTFYHVSAVETISYLEPDLAAKLRVAHPGDVIIVTAGETVEDLGKGVAWLGDRAVVIHDACFAFSHSQNSKYISHFLQTEIFRSQIKKFVSSGKISSIHASGLGKALIPIPPLSEQERIVEILDKFDALVNDISQGLPAEIRARRKQYEYYRNKLLTFKPLAN